MEVSRLTFRKETKEAMEKKLNRREVGELRHRKLKELDQDGTLAFIKTRRQLAEAVGFSGKEDYSRAMSWAHGMIANGYLTEILQGFDPKTNLPVYEYHTTNKEYRYGKYGKSTQKNKGQSKVATKHIPEVPQPVLDTPTEPEVTVLASPIELELAKGDVYIKVKLGNTKDTSELIKMILNGA